MLIGAIISLVCSLVLGFLGGHLGQAVAQTPDFGERALSDLGGAFGDALVRMLDNLTTAPLSLDLLPGSPAFAPTAISFLLALTIPWLVYVFAIYTLMTNDRPGEEHGSSRWAKPAEIIPFAKSKNDDPRNVLLFSMRYGLALSRKGFDLNHDRNLNVVVVGGSGTGKTRYYVKPNVMQMNCHYIITDPKGEDLLDLGHMLVEDGGYDVRNFDTFVTENSMVFNPLAYVKTDLQIVEWVGAFFAMTSDDQKKGGDQFWDDSAQLLLGALIGWMRDYGKLADYNIGGLLKLLNKLKASENESYKSPIDEIFDQVRTGYKTVVVEDERGGLRALDSSVTARALGSPVSKRQELQPTKLYNRTLGKSPYDNVRIGPDGKPERDEDGNVIRGFSPDEDFSLGCYDKFKSGAGKTLQSIIISVNVKFNAIATKEVLGVLAGDDEMHLEDLGTPDKKVAIFCTFKDFNQSTLGFLHGMLVWQALNVMGDKAIRDYGGKLPVPVNLICDEFKSLHMPKSIADLISVIRSRNICMSIILQSLSQLEELYDKPTATAIKACCDTLLFLGSKELDTCKEISEAIGKQTIVTSNFSVSHGGSGGYSKSQQTSGRDLIDPSELMKLPGDECVVAIRGASPAKDKKYPLERHPAYDLVDPGHAPVGKKAAKYKEKFDKHAYITERRRREEEARREAALAVMRRRRGARPRAKAAPAAAAGGGVSAAAAVGGGRMG